MSEPNLTSLLANGESEALNLQGCRQLRQGAYEDALLSFRSALELDPASPLVLNNLGNALFNLQRTAEAQDAYERALTADDGYADAHRNLAVLHQAMGRNGEAAGAYRRYLSQESEDGEAHHNLGLLYVSEGRGDDAIAEFQQASQYLSPNDAETATNLGVGYFFRADLTLAAALFRKALAMDESHVAARYHLGVTRLCDGYPEEAIEALERVIGTEPDYPQAQENLGVAYNTASEPRKAIEVFERLLERQPGDISVLLNLGYSYQDAGFSDRAAAAFRRASAWAPEGSSLAIKAAEALAKMNGNVREAESSPHGGTARGGDRTLPWKRRPGSQDKDKTRSTGGQGMVTILESAVSFFTQDDWRFTLSEDRPMLETAFSGEIWTWPLYAVAREEERQLVLYSRCPVNAPEERRMDVAEFVTRANYGLMIGNFEEDLDDGEVRYKTSIDVEGDELSAALMRQLVYANVLTMDRYLPGIIDVIAGTCSARDAVERIEREPALDGVGPVEIG